MSEIKRVLIVRTDSASDNVLAAGMMPHVKRLYPGAQVSVICQTHLSELYEHSPFVDRVLVFDAARMGSDERYVRTILDQLQDSSFDIMLNTVFSRDPLNDLIATRCGAREQIAFEGDLCNTTSDSREANNRHYTTLVESAGEWRSELDRHEDFLSAIGVEEPCVEPAVWTSPQDESYAETLFTAEGLDPQTTIAVFPGAQGSESAYRRYADILQRFPEFSLVVLGPLADIVLASELCLAFAGKAVNLAGRTNLLQMASVLRRCRAYLGADSVAAHMACAVGLPNVTILGGGHFGRFLPYSPLTTAVSLPLDCYRCNWQCPFLLKMQCVSGVSPEVVVEAVRIALAGEGSLPRLVMHQETATPAQALPASPAWQDCTEMLCRPTEVIRISAEVSRSVTDEAPREAEAAAKPESRSNEAVAPGADSEPRVERHSDLIAIDAVFFQWTNTGIARVWSSLLQEWARDTFGARVVVLDREGSAPRIPGIRYRDVPRFPAGGTLESDRYELERACREEGASLFASTYYTFPRETRSVFVAYDMVPEATGMDLRQSDWERKRLAIQHASSYIAISESTANDLARFHPNVRRDQVTVAHCGVGDSFFVPSENDIRAFSEYAGTPEHYYVHVGSRAGYKNGCLLFDAFARLNDVSDPGLFLVGGTESLEPEFLPAIAGKKVIHAAVDDNTLRMAYAGAAALIYPSRYEGFGLPILEAMACGCPVIACRNSSIPEVGGDAIVYVSETDPDDLARAMAEITQPSIRRDLIQKGLQRAALFKWSDMAVAVSRHFDDAQVEARHPACAPRGV